MLYRSFHEIFQLYNKTFYIKADKDFNKNTVWSDNWNGSTDYKQYLIHKVLDTNHNVYRTII